MAAGTHIVGVLSSGYLPARREVVLAGGATENITFALEPSEAALAHLVVRSPVPGAEVVVDGQRVGVTPLSSSLTVKPGTRVVELRRTGYFSVKRDISLGDGASGELALPLEQDPAGSAAFGVLSLEISEPDASVAINGQDRGVYRNPFRLPAGPHVLAVERGGFESTSRVVEVNVSGTTVVRVSLAPTPQTRSARAERTRSLRQLGWVSLISGGVVGVAGGTFAALAHGLHGDAQDALATTQATFVPGGVCDPKGAGNHAACDAGFASRSKAVDDQSLRRTLGVVAAGVGLAAAVTGAILLTQNSQVEGSSSSSLSIVPLVGVTAQGATIEFQGRF